MKDFIKGVDISTMLELSKRNVKYYDNGESKDLIKILIENGINAVRLRIWNSPFDSDGVPYGGGTDDLITIIEIAKRCKAAGMSFLLDFHYSDFWADKEKQIKPKAWKNYSFEELKKALSRYSSSVIEYLNAAGVCPDMVQPGNEIVNGILWPDGRIENPDRLYELLSSAISGVKKAANDIKIVLHLSSDTDSPIYRGFLDVYNEKLEYDMIGFSYYPYKSTMTLNELVDNMKIISKKYDKELLLVETAMPYTTEDYGKIEKLNPHARKGMAASSKSLEFEISKEGQADYIRNLIDKLSNLDSCKGIYYWEPDWIPVVGSGWATSASLKYLNVVEPCGNEWANQALFDYEGNVLPALKEFK